MYRFLVTWNFSKPTGALANLAIDSTLRVCSRDDAARVVASLEADQKITVHWHRVDRLDPVTGRVS